MKVDVYATENSGQSENNEQITQITLLMPVWGYRFTGRFLEFCLPTLLAPNNIPALARELPCRFVLLSSEGDVPLIRAHPAWHRLTQICGADIELIDDLITHANHTATITLAFERALRQAGAAMRNTCFFFLMSDYLVADGSLATVLRIIRSGARAVLAGNFQVIAEDAVPLLRGMVDSEALEIILPPRELVGWSLAHLHPATVANIVNFGLTHNAHINRLFWRIDETALIGRFYLMHPLAIHPEVTDFVIESSWDYSFLPELCPSGNITPLTDSDQYLVVELQRRDYESENLRPGPIVAKEVAVSLSSWATAGHRANVEHTLLFHAGDPPENLGQVVAQAETFVQSVRDGLATLPIPHRDHPYWLGSMAMNRWRSNRALNKEDWIFILNDAPPPGRIDVMLQKLRDRMFGFPPAVTRWHPWRADYQLPVAAFDRIFAANERLLLIAQDAAAFARWITRAKGDIVTIGASQLLTLARIPYASLIGSFDACFLILSEEMLGFCDTLIARVLPLLKQRGRIHVLIYNDRPLADAEEFAQFFAANAARLSDPAIQVEDVQYVASSRFRWSVRRAFARLTARIASGSKFALPYAALTAGPILLATYFAGRARPSGDPPQRRSICSSVFVTLKVSNTSRTDAVAGHAALKLTARGREPAPIPEERYGIEALNWTTEPNPDTPRRLASTLTAYQFAADLMVGQNEVAEIGLAHALGTRVVLQKVEMLRIFDPRTRVVGELHRQFANHHAFDAQWHDLLGGPTPHRHDSIYSIDFIQYLSHDEEEVFISNLRASLRYDFGFVLIGCRSFNGPGVLTERADHHELDTQLFFSLTNRHSGVPTSSLSSALEPNTLAGPTEPRVYRRSGEELVSLMKRYFHNVFAFSLIGQKVQAGVHRNSEHVFALGCGKKN
jgi:hypothetical protein